MDLDAGKYRPWSTVLAIIGVSLIFMGSGEGIIRTLRWAGYYPIEFYGTGNNYLEQRLHQMDVFYQENGSPHFLVIGNSKVGQGVNPELVSRTYEEVSGKPTTCFNFGFGGNTSEFLPIIFRILQEDYAPRKYVFDVLGPYQMNNESQKESKWLRYRSGDFNISGWMIDHFHLMRMFLRMRHWMEQPREDFELETVVQDQGKLRDPEIPAERRQALLEKERAAREEGLSLSEEPEPGTDNSREEEIYFSQVFKLVGPEKFIIFEFPVSFRVAMGLSNLGYLMKRSENLSREYDMPLLRMADLSELPVDSWMRDGVHMETPGVNTFSSWLGRALAELDGAALQEKPAEPVSGDSR